jgi:hypothetical protein
MKNPEFVVWLQGYLELCEDDVIDRPKIRIIRNHLNLVKAVEGHLSELNETFYETTSLYLEDKERPIPENLDRELYARLLPLFRERFPEGYLEEAGIA